MVLALREVSRHMVVILSDGAFPDPKDFPNFLKAKVRSKSIADVGSLPVMQFLPIIRGFLVFASCIAAASAIGNHELTERAADPCAVVGGKKWVNPKDLRACFTSVKVDPVQKENVRLDLLPLRKPLLRIEHYQDHPSYQQDSSVSYFSQL